MVSEMIIIVSLNYSDLDLVLFPLLDNLQVLPQLLLEYHPKLTRQQSLHLMPCWTTILAAARLSVTT